MTACKKTLLCWLVLLSCLATPGFGHEARPVYFQLQETLSTESQKTLFLYQINWQIPLSVPDFTLPSLELPAFCTAQTKALLRKESDAYVGKQLYHCSQALPGNALILSFPAVNPSVTTLIRLSLANGQQLSQLMKPGDSQWQVPARENTWSVAQDYTLLGIEHIWAGIDHLLFVACLIFIARSHRRILITITGFTVAHSITLFLATLEWVQLPVPPVEAAIALSIVFLAHEIAANNDHSWTFRFPIAVSASFGLLHGFGFAAVLGELGLPQTELGTALLFFNIGVEVGQLLFIASLLLLTIITTALYKKITKIEYSTTLQQLQTPASYVIGTIASYWMIDRIAGFWS